MVFFKIMQRFEQRDLMRVSDQLFMASDILHGASTRGQLRVTDITWDSATERLDYETEPNDQELHPIVFLARLRGVDSFRADHADVTRDNVALGSRLGGLVSRNLYWSARKNGMMYPEDTLLAIQKALFVVSARLLRDMKPLVKPNKTAHRKAVKNLAKAVVFTHVRPIEVPAEPDVA